MAAYVPWQGQSAVHHFSDTEIEVSVHGRWWGVLLLQRWRLRVRATMRPRRRWKRLLWRTPTDVADQINLEVQFIFPSGDGRGASVVNKAARCQRLTAEQSFSVDPFATRVGPWWSRQGPVIARYDLTVHYGGEVHEFTGDLTIEPPPDPPRFT